MSEYSPLRKLVLENADKQILKNLILVKQNKYQMSLNEETKQLIIDTADYIRDEEYVRI